MLINDPTIFLVDIITGLQDALDNKDIRSINQLMSRIYPDYNKEHVETLIAYNLYSDIKAKDIVDFHYLNPQAAFISLFLYEDHIIKFMCNHDMREYFTEGRGSLGSLH